MTFNTSSLGSAKTFPGGRKDFKDFQELRHLVIEEQRIVDSLEEPADEKAANIVVNNPDMLSGALYHTQALSDIAPPEYIPDIEPSVFNG